MHLSLGCEAVWRQGLGHRVWAAAVAVVVVVVVEEVVEVEVVVMQSRCVTRHLRRIPRVEAPAKERRSKSMPVHVQNVTQLQL